MVASEIAEQAGIEINAPGGDNTAFAEDVQICASRSINTGECLEWVTVTRPTPTPPGGNTTPTSPKPTTPKPKPTPTTLPYGERNNDGDAFNNSEDNCDDIPNDDQANFDGDIDGDVCDGDVDGDGLANEDDGCAGTMAPEAVDGSGCAASQRDDDGDGVLGGTEAELASNPANPDTDGDGKTDGAEIYEADGLTVRPVLDVDADGILDHSDSGIDADRDGVSPETGDSDEADACVPNPAAAACDTDRDGLTLVEEKAAGTDPGLADTDGDGVGDGDDKQIRTLRAGESVDGSGVVVTSSASTSSTGSNTTDVEKAPAIAAGGSSSPDGTGTSSGLVAGIIALAALLGAGIYWLLVPLRRRRRDEAIAKATT